MKWASRTSGGPGRRRIATILASLAIVVLFWPILHVASLSFLRDGRLSAEAYARLLDPLVPAMLLRTLALALGSTAVAFGLGVPAAFLLETRAFPARGWLRTAALAPLLLPPTFQVAAWERLSGPRGPLAAILPFAAPPGAPFPLRGLAGACLILGISASPILFFFASAGVRSIRRELVDAAILFRRRGTVLRRVVVPLAAPSILAGSGIAFTLAFLNYEVPRLLDVSTYPVLLQVSFGAEEDPGLAFAYFLPALVAVGAFLYLAEVWADRRGFALTGRESPESLSSARRPGLVGWGFIGGWLVLAELLPVGILASLVGEWRTFAIVLVTDGEKIAGSCLVALLAGMAAAVPAFLLLVPPRPVLPGTGPWSRRGLRLPSGTATRALLWLPLAVPGMLLGFSVLRLGRLPLLAPVLDGPWVLVVAAVLRFFPLAYFALLAQLRSVPAADWEAAALGPGALRRWAGARVPLALPGIRTGATAVALFASAELPASLLVAPPGHEPLMVRIYNLLHYDPERDVLAALCLWHVVTMILVCAAISLLGSTGVSLWIAGRRRRGPAEGASV